MIWTVCIDQSIWSNTTSLAPFWGNKSAAVGIKATKKKKHSHWNSVHLLSLQPADKTPLIPDFGCRLVLREPQEVSESSGEMMNKYITDATQYSAIKVSIFEGGGKWWHFSIKMIKIVKKHILDCNKTQNACKTSFFHWLDSGDL